MRTGPGSWLAAAATSPGRRWASGWTQGGAEVIIITIVLYYILSRVEEGSYFFNVNADSPFAQDEEGACSF